MPYDNELAILDNPLLAPSYEGPPPFETGLTPGYAAPIAYPYQQNQQDVPPPQEPIDPRENYIAAQLRLADLIRQRGEREADPALIASRVAESGMAPLRPGETMPQGLRQPNDEELALRADIENQQRAGTFGPPRQLPRPTPYFSQAKQALDNAVQNINRWTSTQRSKSTADTERIYKITQQMQAQNAYNSTFARTGDPNAAMQAALPYTVNTPGFGAAFKAAQPPPGDPRVMNIPGGGTALIDARGTPHFVPANTAGMPDVDPSIKVLKDPVSGKDILVLRTGPRSFQHLPDQDAQARTEMLKESMIKTKDMLQTRRPLMKYGGVGNEDKIKKIDDDLKTEEDYRKSLFDPITPKTVTPPDAAPTDSEISQPQPSTKTNEVIRLTKDGKRAIFDATTKKFLRYAS